LVEDGLVDPPLLGYLAFGKKIIGVDAVGLVEMVKDRLYHLSILF
jgi:hypothetical protein